MAADDKGDLLVQLRKRLEDLEPLPDESNFFFSNETLVRFLKARDWQLNNAEQLLRATVEWRRSHRPLHTDCKWCHEKPGYHCMRQVGFDEMGRPVLYACFAQAASQKLQAHDAVTHTTFLIENAKRTMNPGIQTWVFIMDCTGMNIHSCNPRLGYSVTQVLANHYPERLGKVIILNHNPLFQGVLNAMKVFMHPNTVAKIQLVKGRKKINDLFSQIFSHELSSWLLEEISLNKRNPMPITQKQFWYKPLGTTHDPRGAPSYVKEYIDTYRRTMQSSMEPLTIHQPHPNVIDVLVGKLNTYTSLPDHLADISLGGGGSGAAAAAAGDSDDEADEAAPIAQIEIADEYRIPENAASVHM